MIKKILKQFSTFTLSLATGLLITGCASLEDNLTGVPIASVSHYEYGRVIEKFYVNEKGAGSNSGGYSSPMTSITLNKNFSGPLTLDIKWKVCNFKHGFKKKVTNGEYCKYETYESKVSVHVLDTPADSAYIYLHFFKDNRVEAWMTKYLPESKSYPGPEFPDEKYPYYE